MTEAKSFQTQSGPEMSGNQFEAVRLLTQHPVNSDLYSRGANAGRVEMAVDTDLPGHSSPEFLRKQPEPLVRPTSAPNPSGFPGGFYVAQTAQPGCPPPPYTTDNNLTSGQPHLVYQPVVNSGPGPAAFMFPGGGVYYAAANQSPSVMGAYIAYNTQHLPYHLGEFPQQFCSPTHQRHMGIPPTANTGCPACSHTHNGCQLAMANPNVMTNYQAVEVVADSIPTEQFRSNSFGTVRSPKAERRQQISNAERDCPVTRLNESITKKMTANHDRTTDDFHTTSESNDFTRPHQSETFCQFI